MFVEKPIEIESHKNIRVTVSAPVRNSWAYVAGDLVDEQTGLVVPFSVSVEYYFGSGWSEGGRTSKTFISSAPAGKYTLRLEVSWDPRKRSLAYVQVDIHQGVRRPLHAFLALLALSAIPAILLGWFCWYEKQRWADSPYT